MPHGDTNTYIRTFSGGRYWPLDPKPEDVRLVDIAHSLAMQCRFTGHTRIRYSIAEHVCRAAWWAYKNHDQLGAAFESLRWFCLYVLHHDDEEFATNDLTRPVKHSPEMVAFREMADKNEAAVHEAMGLRRWEKFHPYIKMVDRRMLSTEQQQLMRGSMSFKESKPLPIKLTGWSPLRAKYTYLVLHSFFHGCGWIESMRHAWREGHKCYTNPTA